MTPDELSEIIGGCTACPLQCRRIGPGHGSNDPVVLVVLSTPADIGDLLDPLQGLPTYITTLTKCDPAGDLFLEDIQACEHFLGAQVEMLDPAVIVAMGRPAALSLGLKAKKRWRRVKTSFQGIPVVPTFHPNMISVVPTAMSKILEDIDTARTILE